METVLTKLYEYQDRPYSQKELKMIRERNIRYLYLSNVAIKHEYCGHIYKTRKDSKKEAEYNDNNLKNNCSVCWKLKKMGRLKHAASTVVKIFTEVWADEPTVLTYDDVDVEKVYYIWLYEH